MKKLILILFSLFLIVSCFANGTLDEKKRIEQRILSHPAVESVKAYQVNDHLIRSYNYWNIKIYLKNNGYMYISSARDYCKEETLSTGCFDIDCIDDYEFWYVYGGSGSRTSSGSKLAFSSILQINLNCIEDYIDNYDKILKIAIDLSKETIEERTYRLRKMCYTDSEFLNYFGNHISQDYWCQVFARYFPRGSKTYTDFFYPYKNNSE